MAKKKSTQNMVLSAAAVAAVRSGDVLESGVLGTGGNEERREPLGVGLR
jgi:hypothetical protein